MLEMKINMPIENLYISVKSVLKTLQFFPDTLRIVVGKLFRTTALSQSFLSLTSS